LNEKHDTLAVLRLFINVHYGSWITTAFCVGVFNGVTWGFLFWHLENIGQCLSHSIQFNSQLNQVPTSC
jgi:hypothetical protein